MIELDGTICYNFEKVLTKVEPLIKGVTNSILSASLEKEDCRQLLRLKVWNLYNKPDRKFNIAYLNQRLKFDTINFITRDSGYNFIKSTTSLESFSDAELENIIADLHTDSFEKMLTEIDLESLIERASLRMTHRHKECLVLFLSGAPTDMIRKFLGTRTANLTRYYILLAEALSIIKEVNDASYKQ